MLKKAFAFVKFEHSVFSLPLLFAGALLASPWTGWAGVAWGRLGWIVLAGVGARTAALALNRLLDRAIDARNPRTKMRELPSGKLSATQAWAICGIGTFAYLVAAWQLGPLCLQLSPIPLIVFVAYPLMKRFTHFCHFGVGLGLALAPLGGSIGYSGAWPDNYAPWLLAGFTLAWVAGFDVLYALLDEDFDRKEGLHSVPAQLGRGAALDMSLLLHALAILCLAALAHRHFFPHSGWLAWAALLPAIVLLASEQRLGYSLEPGSPFFTVNAWVGVAVLGFVATGVL